MKMIKKVLAIVALFAVSACNRAPAPQPPAVVRTAEANGSTMTVSIDRDKVEAGQAIHLTIETTGTLPPPALPSTFGPFDVRPLPQPADHERAPDAPRRSTYALSTLDAGTAEIPAIEAPLGAATDDASAPVLRVEPITVEVTSLLGGDEDPKHYRDVKGIIDIDFPRDWRAYAVAATIAVAALVLVAMLIAWLRRPARLVPELPAHLRALHDLKELEARRLPVAGRVHEYFVVLSDVVRCYIERRYGIRAPELTTPEFLRESRRASSIATEHQAMLANFLVGADLVKFGGVTMTVPECNESMADARRFVEESAASAASAAREPEVVAA